MYKNFKFILPSVGSGYKAWAIDYDEKLKLEDIEKALCFLSGKRFDGIRHITDVYDQRSHFGEWMSSEFFDTKLFKKRTMHFKWLDEALRADFNAVVAEKRWGELPETTKAGVYK